MNDILSYVLEAEDEIFGLFGDKDFLAMNFPCEVLYKGELYPSAANAFFSARCETELQKDTILKLEPYKVKEYARTLPIPLNWIDVRLKVMTEVVTNKFNNEELLNKLLETDSKKITNANHWGDTFWGTDEKGKGENRLGQILVSVRNEKKQEVKIPEIKIEKVEEDKETGFSLKNFKKTKR